MIGNVIQFIDAVQKKTLDELVLTDLVSIPQAGPVLSFRDISTLSRVNMPGLQRLYQMAFYNCQNLTEVNLPAVYSVGTSAFANCIRLSSVSLPGLLYADAHAFVSCKSLPSLYLPNLISCTAPLMLDGTTVSVIDLPNLQYVNRANANLVNNCPKLETLNLGKLMSLGSYNNAVIIANCASLTHVSMPECVYIYEAFLGCTNLDFSGIYAPNLRIFEHYSISGSNITAIVHSSLMSLGLAVQASVPNLSLISLPSLKLFSTTGTTMGVTELYLPQCESVNLQAPMPNVVSANLHNARYLIGLGLSNTSTLSSLDIQWSKVLSIGDQFLSGTCPAVQSLSELNLTDCQSIGHSVFGSYNRTLRVLNCPKARTVGRMSDYTALETVNMPEVSWTPDLIFYSCIRLTTVNFQGLPSVTAQMFEMPYTGSASTVSLPALSVSIPNASTIGSSAFAYNAKVYEISLPNVVAIYPDAFSHCTNLMSVYLPSSGVAMLYQSANYTFAQSPIMVSKDGVYGSVFVPASLVSVYKTTAAWAPISDRITAIPE